MATIRGVEFPEDATAAEIAQFFEEDSASSAQPAAAPAPAPAAPAPLPGTIASRAGQPAGRFDFHDYVDQGGVGGAGGPFESSGFSRMSDEQQHGAAGNALGTYGTMAAGEVGMGAAGLVARPVAQAIGKGLQSGVVQDVVSMFAPQAGAAVRLAGRFAKRFRRGKGAAKGTEAAASEARLATEPLGAGTSAAQPAGTQVLSEGASPAARAALSEAESAVAAEKTSEAGRALAAHRWGKAATEAPKPGTIASRAAKNAPRGASSKVAGKIEPKPGTIASRAKAAKAPAKSAPSSKAPKRAVDESLEDTMQRSLALEKRMKEIGLTSAQKSALREELIGPVKELKMGRLHPSRAIGATE